MKHAFLIFIAFLAARVYAQEDIVLTEVPGIRNKEDFITQFFTDYKGMTWMRSVNKIYRITGGKDELVSSKGTRQYLIKETQLWDSIFYTSYQNNKLSKLSIVSRKMEYLELPARLNNCVTALAEPSYFLAYAQGKEKMYKLHFDPVAQVSDSFSIPLSAITTFKYLGDETIIITRQDTAYLYDMKAKRLTRMNFKYDYYFASYADHRFTLFEHSNPITVVYKRNNGIMGHEIKYFRYHLPVQNAFLIRGHALYKENNNDCYILEDSNGSMSRLRFVRPDGAIWRFQNVYAVYQDKADRVYLATEKGIFFFNLGISKFIDYYVAPAREKSPNPIEIRNALYIADKGELLLGTGQQGVYTYKYDTAGKRFKQVPNARLGGNFNSVCIVTRLYKDRGGKLWVCTSNGIDIYDNGRRKSYDLAAAWDIVEDSFNYWLVSSIYGLCSIDKTTWRRTNYGPEVKVGTMAKTWHILQEGDYLYVSGYTGIFVFDKRTKSFNNRINNVFSHSFADQMCWHMTKDYRNPARFIVSTQASGLYHIAGNGTNKSKILPGVNEIFQCYSGPAGNIASSRQSLFFFETSTQAYTRFRAGDYPLPENLGFHGFCTIGNDRLCVTGTNGFSVIKLQALKDYIARVSPSVFIQDIEVLNHHTYHYPGKEEIITLPHDMNHVRITLNSDYLGTPSDMNIVYYLSGYEGVFRFSGTNEIRFNNMAPGTYKLSIFCQAANGMWNKHPVVTTIIILPPWYNSLWARTGYIVLIVLAIWAIFSWYRKQSERSKKLEIERLEHELKALRSQMNPHFMFNALNAVQQYILERDKDTAIMYLADFSRLIRQILDNSSEETLPLPEEIDWLYNYQNLERMRYGEKFNFDISLGEGIEMHMKIPTMILQPFIENAVYHGLFNKTGKGNLDIRLRLYNEALIECVIEDDGIGRPASANMPGLGRKHVSRGIDITLKRMMYINEKYKTKGSITIVDVTENMRSAGTRVIILIPFFRTDKND